MTREKLVVLVTTPPHDNLTVTAITLIEAALLQGIDVIGVFFYQDGVINANVDVVIPNDEFQPLKRWQALHQTYKLPLHLCITAAEKRGLSDEKTTGTNIDPAFTVAGLGELVELTASADRVLQL